MLLRASELVEPTANGDKVSSFAAPIISQIYAYTAGANQHYGLYDDADSWAERALDFGLRHNILFAQATAYEFHGEDAVHKGEFEKGLEWAEKEFVIVAKLESRERRAWTHFYAGHCYLHLDKLEEAEREFTDGLSLAEAVGEARVKSLHKPNLAWVQALRGRFDDALNLGLENAHEASASMIYTRFEALRCLAAIRFLRAKSSEFDDRLISGSVFGSELDEAARLCSDAEQLVSQSESRVSQLWLGPLHIEVLLEQATRAEAANELALANEKRTQAKSLLESYQQLVSECQSPRFKSEAIRLAELMSIKTDEF